MTRLHEINVFFTIGASCMSPEQLVGDDNHMQLFATFALAVQVNDIGHQWSCDCHCPANVQMSKKQSMCECETSSGDICLKCWLCRRQLEHKP